VSCDAPHDAKFAKRGTVNLRHNSTAAAHAKGGSRACATAPRLAYPCAAADFHALTHAHFAHLETHLEGAGGAHAPHAANGHAAAAAAAAAGGGGGGAATATATASAASRATSPAGVSPPLARLLSDAGDAGSIVSKGLYAHHLAAWLEHFPATQLKVLKPPLAGTGQREGGRGWWGCGGLVTLGAPLQAFHIETGSLLKTLVFFKDLVVSSRGCFLSSGDFV
jgi:hypothetical protein